MYLLLNSNVSNVCVFDAASKYKIHMLVPELLLNFCHAACLYMYTMCNEIYAYDACTNQQQQQYRRLADEDDELSEVQPGIFSVLFYPVQ